MSWRLVRTKKVLTFGKRNCGVLNLDEYSGLHPPVKLPNTKSKKELEEAILLRTPSKPKGDMRSKALPIAMKSVTAWSFVNQGIWKTHILYSSEWKPGRDRRKRLGFAAWSYEAQCFRPHLKQLCLKWVILLWSQGTFPSVWACGAEPQYNANVNLSCHRKKERKSEMNMQN